MSDNEQHPDDRAKNAPQFAATLHQAFEAYPALLTPDPKYILQESHGSHAKA